MIAVVYFLLLSISWADDLGACGHLVTAKQTQDHTEGLIALFEDLLERQVLNLSHLNRLVVGLEKNEIANPILESETWTSSSSLIYYHAIQKYLSRGQIEQSRILDWTVTTLKEMGQTRELKDEVREKTRTPIYKMEFNPIEGKPFKMGINGWKWNYGDNGVKESKPVNLTHTFELTSTHVTEAMWAEIMGDTPKLKEIRAYSEETTAVEINGKLIHLRPNHPVSNVSWLSAVKYANRLSALKGLKPAYDLSGIIFDENTSEEKGNLRAVSGKVKINAPNGDIYQAEGFRLPTEAEYAFLLQFGGPPETTFPFGNNLYELKNYEWHMENSKGSLQAVAGLSPYTFNGHDFYDLIGNMSIWMHDIGWGNRPDGMNPRGFYEGRNHVSRSASYFCTAHSMNSYIRSDSHEPSTTRGFRLARTIKYTSPPEQPKPISLFQKIIGGLLK